MAELLCALFRLVTRLDLEMVFDLMDRGSWPQAIADFTRNHADVFLGWECSCCKHQASSDEYDRVSRSLCSILAEFSMIGYHCTKLTDGEIHQVYQEGMKLQNEITLRERIEVLRRGGAISQGSANQLISRNEAGAKYRAHMLWFCFFVPRIAEQAGIERFFRSWGGEALYNSHERDPDTGPILNAIGTPCVVEAAIPISSLGDWCYPDGAIMRRVLGDMGHRPKVDFHHEAYSKKAIPAENIRNIHRFPSQQFSDLTGCESWSPPL